MENGARIIARLDEILDGMRELVARLHEDARRLRCAECGLVDREDERGWTLRLDEDEELQAFCPDCDRREFSGGGTG